MRNQCLTLWFTGISGSGKTTISQQVERELRQRGCPVEVLDGDVVRTHLSKGLSFSKQDKDINIRRIEFVANFSRNGVMPITAAISPYHATRNKVRRMTDGKFIEVYVNAPLEVCESRDVKELYAMARAGEIKGFTGIDDPYEEPLNPEITCYTALETVEESAAKVVNYLDDLGYLPPQQTPALTYAI